jgi:cytochrome c oxidase cbb3-type subunit III
VKTLALRHGDWLARNRPALIASLTLLAGALAGCEREQRRFQDSPRAPTPAGSPLLVSTLQPGPAVITPQVEAPYDDNAYSVSEGKTLYNSMNCAGCHFQGGGGIGPALMDNEWIYGSEPQQVYASIAEGRPNGMPAWKYMLNSQQTWQLVSYVRSLSALNPKGARGGRDDHMMRKPPEASTPNARPRTSRSTP